MDQRILDNRFAENKFEALVVKEMATPGCFDEACEGTE